MTLSWVYEIDIGFGLECETGRGGDKNTKTKIRHIESAWQAGILTTILLKTQTRKRTRVHARAHTHTHTHRQTDRDSKNRRTYWFFFLDFFIDERSKNISKDFRKQKWKELVMDMVKNLKELLENGSEINTKCSTVGGYSTPVKVNYSHYKAKSVNWRLSMLR